MKIVLIILALLGVITMAQAEDTWTVGKMNIKGKPVIYKFMSQLPDIAIQKKLPWLTVISWKYDGSTNNGMPVPSENKQMITLEDGLEEISGEKSIYLPAYTATGNDLKEFVFYISDRDAFIDKLNKSLSSHSGYPIEINFYKDEYWSDLTKLLEDFKGS